MELDRVKKEILNKRPKNVLLQFPDGLKPISKEIYEELGKEFPNIRFFIFFGGCYGACDIPNLPKIDLVVQWGHAQFVKEKWI